MNDIPVETALKQLSFFIQQDYQTGLDEPVPPLPPVEDFTLVDV
ncbi:hypothetical protein ABLV89_03685 [Staphylococcus equorum]